MKDYSVLVIHAANRLTNTFSSTDTKLKKLMFTSKKLSLRLKKPVFGLCINRVCARAPAFSCVCMWEGWGVGVRVDLEVRP